MKKYGKTIDNVSKLAIHILPVSAVKPDILDTKPQNTALIVCSEEACLFTNLFSESLIIPFADTRDKHGLGSITSDQAKNIVAFAKKIHFSVTDLYICCSEGVSRSPAVAAVLLRMSGRSDKAVWNNPFYSPNPLVYQIICHEAGVFAPTWYVWLLKNKNAFIYKLSKARGNTGKYERWQII